MLQAVVEEASSYFHVPWPEEEEEEAYRVHNCVVGPPLPNREKKQNENHQSFVHADQTIIRPKRPHHPTTKEAFPSIEDRKTYRHAPCPVGCITPRGGPVMPGKEGAVMPPIGGPDNGAVGNPRPAGRATPGPGSMVDKPVIYHIHMHVSSFVSRHLSSLSVVQNGYALLPFRTSRTGGPSTVNDTTVSPRKRTRPSMRF